MAKIVLDTDRKPGVASPRGENSTLTRCLLKDEGKKSNRLNLNDLLDRLGM
jgi:hypothetical protein